MTTMTLRTVSMSNAQFERITDLVRSMAGINLHDGKRELVKARLNKRLRQLGLADFDAYIAHVEHDSSGAELTAMLDALSTNLTSFFREPKHFEHLRDVILPRIEANAARTGRRIRIWSAGCSTGEEPYSIALSLLDSISDLARWDAKILATDLCTEVLAKARAGLYAAERVKTVPGRLLSAHFSAEGNRHDRQYRAERHVRDLVHFARLNLMANWPMSGPFDVIFCRNVMIYFDKATQARLIGRFRELLGPGGTLFLGHSESLAGVEHRFQYVAPTVYRRA